MTVYIETERLKLRDWQDSDLAPFARMNADPLIMEYYPRTLNEKASNRLVKNFQNHINKHGYGFFAIESIETSQFIGFTGLGTVKLDVPFTPATEIAWRLDYGAWGKGYGTEAALACAQQGFNTYALKEIVAFSVSDNTRAVHMMEKIGMTRDAKGDFIYPGLTKEHRVGNYALYRLKKQPPCSAHNFHLL